MDTMDIGTRILLARRKRGLRQGEVAKLARISSKQMSQIETNKRPGVQAGTIAKIAQVLRVSADYLLGLKEEENGAQEEETTTKFFYESFIAKVMDLISKFTFDNRDEAFSHIFSLLATSVEALDNMLWLNDNHSRVGIPILLRTLVEACVDIQFLLKDKSNIDYLNLDDLLLWKSAFESTYQGNQ